MKSQRPSKAAKVDAEQVVHMRKLYSMGWTQGDLARSFGLGIAQVGRIVRNEVWIVPQGLVEPPAANSPEVIASLERLRQKQIAAGLTPLEIPPAEEKPKETALDRIVRDIQAKREKDSKIDQSLEELRGDSK